MNEVKGGHMLSQSKQYADNAKPQFLSCVSILLLTRDIDIAILSVRLSVTRWYCMKTA